MKAALSSIITDFNQQFAKDLLEGFTKTPKELSSKYFYDKKGDKLFQDIMNMPEYYLTNAEYEILDTYKSELSKIYGTQPFDLIELGAGDGYKTKLLLNQFLDDGLDFRYIPIDISQNALCSLQKDLNINLPKLEVVTQQGDYFEVLSSLKQYDRPKVILFLGANIGNFLWHEAEAFFTRLAANLNPNDKVLVGIDLKKNPTTILEAYNDKAGITRDFNLNLLTRINTTFNANFDINAFQHWENYDPITGEAKSYILSTKAQTVYIQDLDKIIYFKAWEAIYVEVSKKYDISEIETLATQSGFWVEQHFFDKQDYFVNTLWEVR